MQHLVQVEEGREAADGAPSAGPTYRCAAGGKGAAPPAVPGLHCCWDIFRYASLLLPPPAARDPPPPPLLSLPSSATSLCMGISNR